MLHLPELLLGPLSQLDLATISEVVTALRPSSPRLSVPSFEAQDKEDVRSFAYGARNLSCCRYALAREVLRLLRNKTTVTHFRLHERFEHAILDMLQGREANESILRQAMQKLLEGQETRLGYTPTYQLVRP
eukprot:symbB.v1.2.004410.t1/scaffold247.1/size253962/10